MKESIEREKGRMFTISKASVALLLLKFSSGKQRILFITCVYVFITVKPSSLHDN